MATVTSADGTVIAYESVGTGPPLILVGGGLDDGAESAPLAGASAARFTVVNYARRGRSGSGDTPPYAVERELEDLAALMAGGSVADAVAAAMPRAERVVIDGASHVADPDLVEPVLERFLRA